jgi:polysaccharide chain length determinant protein (PEP-CTERM system associated)
MDNLDEIKALVLYYLRGIWKNRWIAIIIAWPLLFVGVVYVDQIKDRYRAETKVYIDTTSVLKSLLQGLAVESDLNDVVKLMISKLLSRPNLERAARLMDLDIYVDSPKQMEALISKIRSQVKISTKSRTGTYVISYEDENPDVAKRMVQTLLDIFIEDTLGKSTNQSDAAIVFLDRQIVKYDTLLREAEKRREEFKRNNVGLMTTDGENYYSQYKETVSRVEEAELSLDESIQRHSKVKDQLDELILSVNAENIDVHEFTKSRSDGPIALQEAKLLDLTLHYTDQHPDVINTKLILERLKARRTLELEQLAESLKVNGPDTNNPLVQELFFLLTQIEADISSFRTRVSSLKRKQGELKNLVDIVPQIESRLQRLNRDYDVHRVNYTQLVERRERAKISDDVDAGADQVKFRIIEPPFVPAVAQNPNRPLLDFMVLVGALGIGYGIGLLMSLFQPVFYNQTELGALGRAVLGTVSKFDTVDVLAKRRRNLIMVILVNMLFVTVGIAFIFLHSKRIIILDVLQSKVMAL